MSESWIQTGRGRNRVDGITFRGDGATVAMHLGSSETAGQLDGPPSSGSASFDSPTLLFRLLPGASEYRWQQLGRPLLEHPCRRGRRRRRRSSSAVRLARLSAERPAEPTGLRLAHGFPSMVTWANTLLTFRCRRSRVEGDFSPS